MKTGTSILLLSLCIISSASGVAIKTENNADPPSVPELLLKSGNNTVHSSTCPQDWEQFDQRCFKFNGFEMTWSQAENYCLLLGGNLASVHNIQEYYFIQGLIVTHTQDSPITWIGGSDAQQEDMWFWSDGSKFGYTNWGMDEPNNHDGNEHCLHTNFGDGLLWNDWECSDTYPFVCARRLEV